MYVWECVCCLFFCLVLFLCFGFVSFAVIVVVAAAALFCF